MAPQSANRYPVTVTIDSAHRLHGVAGWENAFCEPLSGGQTNVVWRVQHGERQAVLKLDDESRQPLFRSRRAEAEVHRYVARKNLAADVIYADDRTLMTAFVDGQVWGPSALHDSKNLVTLAAALRELHSLPPLRRRYDAQAWARHYAASIENPNRDLLSLCLEQVAIAEGSQGLCLCHNDLVVENIVSNSGITFLDWEYAGDNDPLFDLAVVVEHHELDNAETELLLCAYFKGEHRDRLAEFATQRRRYLALLWLWLAAGTNADEESLASVGERLFTSCF